MIIAFLLVCLTLVSTAGCATPTLNAFLATLDNKRLLRVAQLCREIYKLPEGADNESLAEILASKELIAPEDKVIMQGYRHGNQLGAIAIKAGQRVNHFTLVFSGTESMNDWATDAMALTSPEEAMGEMNKMMRHLIPATLHIRHKKKHRHAYETDFAVHEVSAHSSHDADKVGVHLGFKTAGKSFLRILFDGLQQYIKPDSPVTFEIYGHSMGGALAAQAAYRIRKRLAEHLSLPHDMVSVDVITFAAAGFFSQDAVGTADRVIGASRSMVNFVRKHDFARELSELAGFANPGHVIELDNFVRIPGSLHDYFHHLAHLQESPFEIFERLHQEAQNHAIKYYIETIEAGIDAIMDKEKVAPYS